VTNLVFLLPLVAVYELALVVHARSLSGAMIDRVIARQILHYCFALLGATSLYLPGLALIVFLAAGQIASKDTWEIHGWTLGWMTVESLLLAVPLLVLSHIMSSYSHLAGLAGGGVANGWSARLLLSLGAGIYEELLFRFILITFLVMLLRDSLKLPEAPVMFSAVLLTAVAFSLYHYLGGETFVWSKFAFRMVAGGYLAGVFILRGFGITVGCHALYDLMAMTLNAEHVFFAT